MIKTWRERMPARLPESMLGAAMMQMQCMVDELDDLRAALADRDAKLTALEGQEPYGYYWTTDGTFEIGQEPVMSYKTGPCSGRNFTPLYAAAGAAPVPKTELTDEEIREIMLSCKGSFDLWEFTRAILAAAREKK